MFILCVSCLLRKHRRVAQSFGLLRVYDADNAPSPPQSKPGRRRFGGVMVSRVPVCVFAPPPYFKGNTGLGSALSSDCPLGL